MAGRVPPHITIVMSLMPWELRHFQRQLAMFHQALSRPLAGSISFDVSLITAPAIIDWQNSKTTQASTELHFAKLTQDAALPGSFRIENDGSILGCVDKRRAQATLCETTDVVCWLDADIHFPDWIFTAFFDALEKISATYFILAPQVPQLWDETWAPLVHPKFRHEAFGFCYHFDPSKEPLLNESPSVAFSLKRVSPLKFAGGWFTLYSAALLKRIGIPNAFSGYGLEDSFLMRVANSLNRIGFGAEQYVLEGLLVAEDYLDEATTAARLNYHLRKTAAELAQTTKKSFDREYYQSLLRLAPPCLLASLRRRLLPQQSLQVHVH